MSETATEADVSAGTEASTAHGDGHGHMSEWGYIKIAIYLGIITLAEVAIVYIESLEGLLAPILILMSLAKFILVVWFFMHLKTDNKLFRRLFVTGLALALFCYTIVLATFHVFSR